MTHNKQFSCVLNMNVDMELLFKVLLARGEDIKALVVFSSQEMGEGGPERHGYYTLSKDVSSY